MPQIKDIQLAILQGERPGLLLADLQVALAFQKNDPQKVNHLLQAALYAVDEQGQYSPFEPGMQPSQANQAGYQNGQQGSYGPQGLQQMPSQNSGERFLMWISREIIQAGEQETTLHRRLSFDANMFGSPVRYYRAYVWVVPERSEGRGWSNALPNPSQGFSQGGFNQGGFNQGGFNQGGFPQGGFNQGGFGQSNSYNGFGQQPFGSSQPQNAYANGYNQPNAQGGYMNGANTGNFGYPSNGQQMQQAYGNGYQSSFANPMQGNPSNFYGGLSSPNAPNGHQPQYAGGYPTYGGMQNAPYAPQGQTPYGGSAQGFQGGQMPNGGYPNFPQGYGQYPQQGYGNYPQGFTN
jgi:hypothetical protein